MRFFSIALHGRLRFALAIVAVLALHSKAYAADYYVDCSLLTEGVGTADAPWNNLATPSALTFVPGDVIALKRGTTCAGMLTPLGSGEPGAPITIGAYGSGVRPVIVAAGRPAALALFNQTHWVRTESFRPVTLDASSSGTHARRISLAMGSRSTRAATV
jgi:hypothetical protein